MKWLEQSNLMTKQPDVNGPTHVTLTLNKCEIMIALAFSVDGETAIDISHERISQEVINRLDNLISELRKSEDDHTALH